MPFPRSKLYPSNRLFPGMGYLRPDATEGPSSDTYIDASVAAKNQRPGVTPTTATQLEVTVRKEQP